MSEDNTHDNTYSKRASQVFREFNISFETLVETLIKKGISPPKDINDKISEAAYLVLQKEFAIDKKTREEAEKKIEQLQTKKKIIVLDDSKYKETVEKNENTNEVNDSEKK